MYISTGNGIRKMETGGKIVGILFMVLVNVKQAKVGKFLYKRNGCHIKDFKKLTHVMFLKFYITL